MQFKGEQFQARVFASYESIHSALAQSSATAVAGDANLSAAELQTKGLLSGQFIASDSLTGLAEALPMAAVIGGACFLGVDENAEAARDMLRHGYCDFVVNSLDEALRILKNELRQAKPVSVCLIGNVDAILLQMAERGVAPQLVMHSLPIAGNAAFAQLKQTGTIFCGTADLQSQIERPPNEDGAITHWTLPQGNASMLARVDTVARELLPEGDRKRRRWLAVASRYLPRAVPPCRVASLTQAELERFADGVSARIMSRDVNGPIKIAVDGEIMLLGNEAA